MSGRIVPERDTAIALYNEGCMLANREQFQAAIDKFDKALQYNPTMEKALHNKALALQRLGRLDDALHVYEQLVDLSSDNPRILNEVGILKTYLDDLDGALDAFNQLIAMNQATPNIYSNKGVILLKQDRLEEAEAVLSEVLASNPDYETARYNLATVYATQLNFAKLKEQLVILSENTAPKDLIEKISNDADFDKIRNTEEFQSLVKEIL